MDVSPSVRQYIYRNVIVLKETSTVMYSIMYDVYNNVNKNICVFSFITHAFTWAIMLSKALIVVVERSDRDIPIISCASVNH